LYGRLAELEKKQMSKREVLEEAKRMQQRFEEIFGIAPENFEFQGKSYTPVQFAQEFFPEINKKIKVYSINDFNTNFLPLGTNKKEFVIFNEEEIKKISLTYESKRIGLQESLHMIENELLHGTPVKVEMAWPYDRTYLKDGVKTPYVDLEKGTLSASIRTKPFDTEMSHAVLIVGLRRDQDGNISGFKILNSYGNHSGDKGFLDVDINYYKNFLVHLYL
jgi:hypothetical protein